MIWVLSVGPRPNLQAARISLIASGCRGLGYTGPETVHVDKRRRGATPKRLWRWMKRRAAVEPPIWHLKGEYRLERNRLKGAAVSSLIRTWFADQGNSGAPT